MYRLADVEDRKIQKIVSRGIYEVFQKAFCGEGEGQEQEQQEVDKDKVERFFLAVDPRFLEETDYLHNYLAQKIEAMMRELLDEKYEYTFDEMGEAIMYLVLSKEAEALEVLEELEDSGENETAPYDFLSENDKQYCKTFAKDICESNITEGLADDGKEDLDEFDKEWIKEYREFEPVLYKALVTPPYLVKLLDEDKVSLIWWDTDFDFIFELGIERFQAFAESEEGRMFNFLTADDNVEEMSGSAKRKIGE